MALGFQPLNSGGVSIPLRNSDSSNVSALVGRETTLSMLVGEHNHLLAFTTFGPASSQRRGRKAGTTNWARERFWRKYAEASRRLSRPYRKIHLAAQIGLAYMTFCKYLALWGPPPGSVGPGE
jgi:hypothetical protein